MTRRCSYDLEAFGFCEYKEPESTLRALRLLHELLLGDKKLLVKVDAKTKAQLDEWKAKNRSANGVCCSSNAGLQSSEMVEMVIVQFVAEQSQILLFPSYQTKCI